MPGYANPFGGRAMGRGRGAGFGGRGNWGRGSAGGGYGRGNRWRHWFYATGLPGWARFGPYPVWEGDPAREKELLSGQIEALQEELAAMQKRFAELESGAARQSTEASS